MARYHRRQHADGRGDPVLCLEDDFADARPRDDAPAFALDERRSAHRSSGCPQRTIVVELRSSEPRTAIAIRAITMMAAIAMIVQVVGLTVVVVVVVVVDVDWLVDVVTAGFGAWFCCVVD